MGPGLYGTGGSPIRMTSAPAGAPDNARTEVRSSAAKVDGLWRCDVMGTLILPLVVGDLQGKPVQDRSVAGVYRAGGRVVPRGPAARYDAALPAGRFAHGRDRVRARPAPRRLGGR